MSRSASRSLAASALALALVLVAPHAGAAAAPVPSDIVAAVLQEKDLAECIKGTDETAAAYLAHALALKELTLRSGEHMVVAEGQEACLSRGQSALVMIFQRTGSGYRRVLDSMAIPGMAQVGTDGVAVLPTHATANTIYEAAYVWNGTEFALSRERTQIFDLALQQRRPDAVRVHFPPGTYATTLSGTTAFDFGDGYAFDARAGQHVKIELLSHDGKAPGISLWFGGDKDVADLEGSTWEGVLPSTGTYYLLVSGDDETIDSSTLEKYSIRIEIR